MDSAVPSMVWGLKPRLWEESEEPGGRPAKEAAKITQCQLAAPPCQVQMEPCLDLTQGSLGQLSPIPGAQGAGGEKICFPLILLPLPAGCHPCLGLPGQGLWASAEGACWLPASVPRPVFGGSGFASVLLSDTASPVPS